MSLYSWSFKLGPRTFRSALLYSLCAALLLAAGAGQPAAAAARATTLRDLPPAAQAVLSSALGRDDTAYAAGPSPDGYRLANPAQQLSAEFTAAGLRVQSAGLSWGLALQAYGDANAPDVPPAAEPRATGNRVEYARGVLTEWYVNGPLGLEQGFTLAAPPVRAMPSPSATSAGRILTRGAAGLTVVLALTGGVGARLDESGTGLVLLRAGAETSLRYDGLRAIDATGRALRAWLELGGPAGTQVQIRVDDAGAQYPVTIDPWVQQAKLTASDGATNSSLGFSLGISADGSTIVAGAYADTVAGHSSQGAAYVFVRPAGGWATTSAFTAKLTASDGAASDGLGDGVAISADGSTIVAGANGAMVAGHANQGAAYVFLKPGGGWATTSSFAAKLTASDGATNDQLGAAVTTSANGSLIVVGAQYAKIGSNSGQGAAYLFLKPGGGWATTSAFSAKLTASDGAAGDSLGAAVDISADGSAIVAGAYGVTLSAHTNQGAAYVFVKPGGGWATTSSFAAKLSASDGAAFDYFGSSVAISADGLTLVSGAYGATIAGHSTRGAAYVFVKPGGGWTTTSAFSAKLTASDGAANDSLGAAVDISANGSSIVAGAYGATVSGHSGQGAAYVFVRPGSGWATTSSFAAKLTASDGAASDVLGSSVAIGGDGLTVGTGAPSATVSTHASQGAAYVYRLVLSQHLYLPLVIR